MKQRLPLWLALGVLAMAALLAAILGRLAYLSLAPTAFRPDPQELDATAPVSLAEQQALALAHPGFLYGRVTTDGGATYEGRLRWGGGQEAFWGDFFNGTKSGNPWAAEVPPDRLPRARHPIEIFGFEVASRERPIDLGRPFMARFGDIARIEALGLASVRVTLKSGTAYDTDYMEANDFDDGVRVWDADRGVVDLGPREIRTIELLPTARLRAAPERLYGTVRTEQGDFTGYIQWDREQCVGSDTLVGRAADGDVSLRFDTLRAIARESSDSSRVTLVDGREIVLSGSRAVGRGNLGLYVDDRRYGRVLVTWDAFERVDFGPGGSGPAYDDFPPGHLLRGSVTTRTGLRLTGRLVYDLDESETTDSLDAASHGVDYALPLGLVASIGLPDRDERGDRRARVTLRNGEALTVELTGDLGPGNAGLLVFVDGAPRPEYVLWGDVTRIDFDRPPATYPPMSGGH